MLFMASSMALEEEPELGAELELEFAAGCKNAARLTRTTMMMAKIQDKAFMRFSFAEQAQPRMYPRLASG